MLISPMEGKAIRPLIHRASGVGLCLHVCLGCVQGSGYMASLIIPQRAQRKPSHAEDGMALTSPTRVEQYTIPETMRSAVLFGPRDIRVIHRPVPQPGPGEVLVKVAMCGTCGSDLKIYDGHFPLTLPYGAFTPGHEWTGTVVALGETVDEFAVGDRVCIEAHHGCGAGCAVSAGRWRAARGCAAPRRRSPARPGCRAR